MIVLGIETATDRVGVAIGDHEGVLSQMEVTRGRRHAETVTPAIQVVCRQADVDVRDVTLVAVDVGPGLFTGLRVGLATGKSIAQALGVPMVGISSLEILAHPLRYVGRETETTIASVVDGRKGQVFYCFFRSSNGQLRRVSEPTAGSIPDLVAAIEDRAQDVLCVGDGALRYREEIGACRLAVTTDQELAHPSVTSLIHLAQTRARRDEVVDHLAVDALYLRRPDAEINWQTRTSA